MSRQRYKCLVYTLCFLLRMTMSCFMDGLFFVYYPGSFDTQHVLLRKIHNVTNTLKTV